MQFEFNGKQLEVPNTLAVKMLTNGDIAEGLEYLAIDYTALNQKIRERGIELNPDTAQIHELIPNLLTEAAIRLRSFPNIEGR